MVVAALLALYSYLSKIAPLCHSSCVNRLTFQERMRSQVFLDAEDIFNLLLYLVAQRYAWRWNLCLQPLFGIRGSA